MKFNYINIKKRFSGVEVSLLYRNSRYVWCDLMESLKYYLSQKRRDISFKATFFEL